MNKNKSQTAIIGKMKNGYCNISNLYSITELLINLVIVHISIKKHYYSMYETFKIYNRILKDF